MCDREKVRRRRSEGVWGRVFTLLPSATQLIIISTVNDAARRHRASKISNTAQIPSLTQTLTLTNKNRHWYRYNKKKEKAVWGKNSPSPFPAIRGLLFQHLVAAGARSEC